MHNLVLAQLRVKIKKIVFSFHWLLYVHQSTAHSLYMYAN